MVMILMITHGEEHDDHANCESVEGVIAKEAFSEDSMEVRYGVILGNELGNALSLL